MLAADERGLHAAAGTRAVRKLRPSTLPDEVLRELRGQLIRGELQPGDRIRADLVAEDLGVSVIPVREALRVLLAESRVELEPHRGYRVTVLSPEQIGEIFLICRAARGRGAAPRHARHGPTPTTRGMLALLAELEAAPSVRRRDRRDAVAADHGAPGLPLRADGVRRPAAPRLGAAPAVGPHRPLPLAVPLHRRVGVRADERRAPCDLRGVPRARRGRGGAAERPATGTTCRADGRRRDRRAVGCSAPARWRRASRSRSPPAGHPVVLWGRRAGARRGGAGDGPPRWRGCSTEEGLAGSADEVVARIEGAAELDAPRRRRRRRRGRRRGPARRSTRCSRPSRTWSRRTRCSPPTRRACASPTSPRRCGTATASWRCTSGTRRI